MIGLCVPCLDQCELFSRADWSERAFLQAIVFIDGPWNYGWGKQGLAGLAN